MLKIVATLLLTSSILFGQTKLKEDPNTMEKNVIKDWRTLNSETYSIQYPTDWELNQSGQMGTHFILFSVLESDGDQFKENVNLLIQDLSDYSIDLNQYTEISEGQVKTMIANSTILESKRIKIGLEEYHRIMYMGDQEPFSLQFVQYYWVRDKKAIVLTFTSEQSAFLKYKEIGELILNSFAFK